MQGSAVGHGIRSGPQSALVDASPVGIVVLDAAMVIRLWNDTLACWSGTPAERVLGSCLAAVLPEFGRPRYQLRMKQLLTTGAPVVFNGSVHRGLLALSDGTLILPHYRVTCRRIEDGEGSVSIGLWIENTTLLGETVGYLRAEIAARREAEDQLQNALRCQETLYRELQHRIRNSLSLISSLVSLATPDVEGEESDLLHEIHSRITSISLVYEQLAARSRYGEVDLAVYLRQLVESVFSSIPRSAAVGDPRMALDHVVVPIDIAIPIGLIVNELITNSMKHAFPDLEEGVITVELREESDRFTLLVADNGSGPGGRTEPGASGLGLGIVDLLAHQIRAELTQPDWPGTAYRLTLLLEELPSL